MACEQWRGKLDAYVDGELESAEASALATHLRTCASCAADALERVQMKRSVQMAGKRYAASAELRNRIAKTRCPEAAQGFGWLWKILAVPALSLLILSVAVNFYVGRETRAPAARLQRTG